MATTYDELVDEIQRWADFSNPNFIASIPDFIWECEVRVSRYLRTFETECRIATPLIPAGVTEATLGVYDLPSDWAGFKSVDRVGDYVWILYHRRIPHLSESNPSNWLLVKHPDLYRYMSLVAAEGWLKNDPRFEFWHKAVDRILKEILLADDEVRYSGGPLVSRLPGQRPWLRLKTRYADGRLDFLPSYDYYDLIESGALPEDVGCRGSPDGRAGYFTIADNKLQIWPKPSMPE